MDAKRFTSNKSGELRKFTNPHTDRVDWLFLPDDLPPRWDFPARLWPLLAEAKEALGMLNGVGRVLPNADLLIRPLQNREAITSSSIEGTFVTAEQLLLYGLDPREPSTAEGKLADWNEVHNYRAALAVGIELLDQGEPILNRHLRSMHQALMQGARGAQKTPGEFRRIQVQVGATGRFIPPPPLEVPRLMADLERYINEPSDDFDPLVRCFMVHYQFEAIHPFCDGNGRIGRLLLALMIYKYLGHKMPLLYLSAYFERHRKEYMDYLLRVSTAGEWDVWVEFCLTGSIEQARDAIRRCEAIRRLRDSYHERIQPSATPRSHAIINSLFESPMLTVPAVAKRWDVTYHTAQKDLKRLVQAGILREMPRKRPRTYLAFELFGVAYHDVDNPGSIPAR